MEIIENQYPPNQPQNTRKANGWKIILGIFLGLSIIGNIILFLAFVLAVMVLATGKSDYLVEKVLQEGISINKIAVIRIEGFIDNDLAESISQQLKTAQQDKRVKAVIFRINSPGGGISASDRIYNEIRRFKDLTDKPTVAFMETVAASGGLYVSCGCDQIIAEPTTITGSIGVIMGTFVLQDLLEQKLGIKPIIIKSGPKKDWPTVFEPVTEEQVQYINEKLISPAYERFVNTVAEARKDLLSIEQVRALADGSIYNAHEALANNLIDEIGYLPEAIALAQKLAKITDAKVVEYKKPFSFEDLMGAKSLFKMDRKTFYEIATPQLMYLWDARIGMR